MFKIPRLIPLGAALAVLLTGCGNDALETAADALEPLNLAMLAADHRLNEDPATTTLSFLKTVDQHWSTNPDQFLIRLETAKETLVGSIDADDSDPRMKRARAILAAMAETREIVTGYAERVAFQRSNDSFAAHIALSAAGADVIRSKEFFQAYLGDAETRRQYAVASSTSLCDTYGKSRSRLKSDPVFQEQVDQFANGWFNQDIGSVQQQRRYGKLAYFSGIGILPPYSPDTGTFAEAPATFVTISSYNAARSVQGREAGTNFDLSCKAESTGMVCTTPYVQLRSDLRGCPYPKQFRVSAELADPKGLLRDTRATYRAERRPKDADALRLQFDIFWSRVPLLSEGREAELMRQVGSAPIVTGILLNLESILPRLGDRGILSDDTLADLEDVLSEVEAPLLKIQKDALNLKADLAETLVTDGLNSAVWIFVILFCSAGSVATVAYHQIRTTEQFAERTRQEASNISALLSGFENFAYALPTGAVIFNRDGAILFANTAFENLVGEAFGGSKEEALETIVTTMGSDSVSNFPQKARNGVFHVPDRRREDNLAMRPIWAAIHWLSQPAWVLVLQDVTDIRKAELASLRSSQLATLGEMSTAVAHEINQPLAIVRAAAQTSLLAISRGQSDLGLFKEKFIRIERQVVRAKAITDQMRMYGGSRDKETATIDLGDCVRSITGMIRSSLESRDIGLDVEAPVSPCPTWGSRIAIEQALMNILINARDAFHSGSDLRLEAALVRVRLSREDDFWLVAITDNAGGIDHAVAETLIHPFVTTKSGIGAPGLGLAVAHGTIKEMGGTLTARNCSGGARFDVRLPYRQEDATDPASTTA